MKAPRRIITWIILSLIIQCSIYFYFDQVYFAPEGDIKFTEISSKNESKSFKPNVKFSDTVKYISLSYDGSYTAYLENNLVKVVDTNTGKSRKLQFSQGVQCLSYKWLPDTNILMIAERVSSNGRRVIKFYSYDAEKQEKKDTDNYQGGVHRVNNMPTGTLKENVDFEISSSTGVLYGKISYTNTASSIYRIDRNEDLTKVSTFTRNIGKTAVASDDDQLAYEDLTSGKIRTNYKNKVISINDSYDNSLLGTDGNDNFYIGVGKGKISKVYYGELSKSTSSWKAISSSKSVSSEDIIISQNGNVYFVDNNKKNITNIKTGKSYEFEGSFVDAKDSFFAYKINNKLVIKEIK